MSTKPPTRPLDVLYDFAMEDDLAGALPTYVAKYPELAKDFAEIAREIDEDVLADDVVLTAEDYAAIDRSWEMFKRMIAGRMPRGVN